MRREQIVQPASPAAIKQGCTCTCIPNTFGVGGRSNPNWVFMRQTCPAHGLKEEPGDEQ